MRLSAREARGPASPAHPGPTRVRSRSSESVDPRDPGARPARISKPGAAGQILHTYTFKVNSTVLLRCGTGTTLLSAAAAAAEEQEQDQLSHLPQILMRRTVLLRHRTSKEYFVLLDHWLST
ncbi:hypothetical protein STEG23_003380, partial [Scotinomys teguina]